MLYCYDERVPLDFYKKEIEFAKKKGQAIFYSETDGFKDSYGETIDIKDKVIMPRTYVTQIYNLNKVIEENGGLLVLSEVDDKKVDNWPKFYKPKRKAIILSGEDLINEDVIGEMEKTLGNRIFIKTKEKNFNAIISLELLKDKKCNFYKALLHHLGDEFIVSKAVHVLEDQYGIKEYRCFVIDGKVANISRYTEDLLHSIDKEVLNRANDIVQLLKGIMPSYYVIDLFEYEEEGRKEIDVVEFNPLQTSGIYLYNSAIEISKDVLHEKMRNVAFEYSDKIDECSFEGTMINERRPLYKVAKSFANDLASICISGGVDMPFFFDVNVTIEDYAKHGPKFSFGGFVPITDDFSLRSRKISSDADLLDSKKLQYKKNDNGDE